MYSIIKKAIVYSLVLFSFMVAFPSPQSFAAISSPVKVHAFNNFPVIFKDTDGVVKGLYVDLLTEIGKKENIKFEYVLGTWSEGLERIKSGEVNLLTSVAYTEERALFMDFTPTPLLTVWGELYALQSSDIDGILKTADKQIGFMAGDINAANFKVLAKQFSITPRFVEFSSYDDVFKAVAEKTIDAGISGVTFGMANENKYGLKSTGVVFNPINLYFTTTKGKNQELLNLLDSYLSKWKTQNNSVFDLAKQKWLGGSIATINVIPNWAIYVLIIFGSLVVATLGFIVLLRLQVKKAITKSKAEEIKFLESEGKYRQLVENSHDIIYTLTKDGNITFASPSWTALLGHPISEVVGKSFQQFVHPDDIPQCLEWLKKVMDSGVRQEGVEYRVKHIDGSWHWHTSSAVPIKGATGEIIGFEGTARDITDKKTAEDSLTEKIKELQEMNKLMVNRELKMVELKKELGTKNNT